MSGGAAQSGMQVQQLRELVASKESTVTSQQTRISRLEALHRLAQESALKCEAELDRCSAALSQAEADKQGLAAELQQSRCCSQTGRQ